MVRLVVMAAGEARRMGRDKLALPWQGLSVLGFVLREAMQSIQYLPTELSEKADTQVELVVVARRPPESYLSSAVHEDFYKLNGIWLQALGIQPLAKTIRMGLEDVGASCQGMGFLPGDQVGVRARSLASLMGTFVEQEPDFLVPRAQDVWGSPVFFHRRYIDELRSLDGEEGGKNVLKRYPELWASYQVDKDFFVDLDTPDDYAMHGKRQRGACTSARR